MIAIAVVLGIIALIALLPIGGDVCYDESGLAVSFVLGPVRFQLNPKKQPRSVRKMIHAAEKKSKTPGKKRQKAICEKKNASQEQSKKGGKLPMLLDFVKLACDFLGGFRRKLLLRSLDLYLTYGGAEPDTAAINYGNTLAAAHGIMPLLQQVFRIRKQDVRVIYDARETELTVYARAVVTIRVGQILSLAVVYGIRALKIYLKHNNNSNGKAVSE